MDYEKNLIGWVLRDPRYFSEAQRFGLEGRNIQNDRARKVWGVFEALMRDSRPIELVSVIGEFGADDLYPLDAMESAPVAVNIKYAVDKICELDERRNFGLRLEQLAKDCLLARSDWQHTKSKITALANEILDKNKKAKSDLEYHGAVPEFLEDVEKRVLMEIKNGIWGIATGFNCLNEALGGWQESSFYVIAARPGIGKTTLALNTCEAVAKQGKHVYFCSNEMSANQLIGKHHSLMTGISYSRILSGDLNEFEKDKLFKAARTLIERNITIGEENGRFIETFEAECIARKREGKLDFAILDYVQQMEVRDKKIQMRAQELTAITNRLKALSRSLKIPILALAQVNRGADENLPSLANLKDSGSIEQDADAVIFLHVDKEHGHCISIAKNRFGIQGIRPLKADLAGNRFYD